MCMLPRNQICKPTQKKETKINAKPICTCVHACIKQDDIYLKKKKDCTGSFLPPLLNNNTRLLLLHQDRVTDTRTPDALLPAQALENLDHGRRPVPVCAL